MWKNYDDLEQSLALDELLVTYEQIMENRSDNMEFQAKIAGAEIKKSKSSQDQGPNNKKSVASDESLVNRLRNKRQSDKISEAVEKGSSTFSDGVGYQVI